MTFNQSSCSNQVIWLLTNQVVAIGSCGFQPIMLLLPGHTIFRLFLIRSHDFQPITLLLSDHVTLNQLGFSTKPLHVCALINARDHTHLANLGLLSCQTKQHQVLDNNLSNVFHSHLFSCAGGVWVVEVTAGESIGEELPSEDPPSLPLLPLPCCWSSSFFRFLLDNRLFWRRRRGKGGREEGRGIRRRGRREGEGEGGERGKEREKERRREEQRGDMLCECNAHISNLSSSSSTTCYYGHILVCTERSPSWRKPFKNEQSPSSKGPRRVS